MTKLTHKEAFRLLEDTDDILLITHRNPDGDAVGSVFAMYNVLREMGKNVRCMLDNVSDALSIPVCDEAFSDFEPRFVISVDLADNKLMTSDVYSLYSDKVFLSIDHHAVNTPYAENLLLDSSASAACEVIYDMLVSAGQEISQKTAEALYLGISTDTGCFRYSNTTAKTLETAARLVAKGINNGEINKRVFETKTKEYFRFESLATSSMRTYLDGKCAVITLTQDMFRRTGVPESDTHSISGLPRQIEGVLIGIVIKEKKEGGYKISVRSNAPASAAAVCECFGGGGHRLAAGCEIAGSLGEVTNKLLKAVQEELEKI